LNLRPLGYEPSLCVEYGEYVIKSAGGSAIFAINTMGIVTKIVTKFFKQSCQSLPTPFCFIAIISGRRHSGYVFSIGRAKNKGNAFVIYL
jgi:hypothetical protein